MLNGKLKKPLGFHRLEPSSALVVLLDALLSSHLASTCSLEKQERATGQ